MGDCGIICAELDAAGCQAGGARDACSPVPAIGAFVRCDSKRGTITHRPLTSIDGPGTDGEVFITTLRLR